MALVFLFQPSPFTNKTNSHALYLIAAHLSFAATMDAYQYPNLTIIEEDENIKMKIALLRRHIIARFPKNEPTSVSIHVSTCFGLGISWCSYCAVSFSDFVIFSYVPNTHTV